MKLKKTPQPLVFVYEGPTALCAAVSGLYRLDPQAPSELCMWQGRYYLQVGARLSGRKRLIRVGERWGRCLGACPVLYSFCREHGCEISQNAVAQLGGALAGQGRKKNGRKREE